jgi:hypothetical protein
MVASEWHVFLRGYRNANPDLTYKTALRKASIAYKNPSTCSRANLKKKITSMSDAQVQETCRKLDSTSSPTVIEKYALLKKKITNQPKLSRQDKPNMPSKNPPARPVLYLEKALESELDKLLDKVVLRVAYYYASSNIWNYKKNMVSFTNKLVKKLKAKHGNLKSEEFDKLVQQKFGRIKSYNKTTALNEKFKTSKVGFEKIGDFLKNKYDIEL